MAAYLTYLRYRNTRRLNSLPGLKQEGVCGGGDVRETGGEKVGVRVKGKEWARGRRGKRGKW